MSLLAAAITVDFASPTRLAIQFHVRCVKKQMHDADFATIQKMHMELAPLLEKLKTLQEAAGALLRRRPATWITCQWPQPQAVHSLEQRPQTVPDGPLHTSFNPPAPPADAANDAAAVSTQLEAAASGTVSNALAMDGQGAHGASTAPVGQHLENAPPDPEDLVYWDTLHGIGEDFDEEVPPWQRADIGGSEDIPAEHLLLVLASNGNTANDFEKPELTIQQKTADALLHQIREVIAEKLFQYTEHIRAAPRKGVCTQARATILEMEQHLFFLCQVYTYCRAHMITLGADADILNTFRQLTHDNVCSSTAVLKPNLLGSTQLKLSWIWQSIDHRMMVDPTENVDTSDPATLLECKSQDLSCSQN